MASPKIACVLLMCLVVLSAPIAQATITCGQATSRLAPCITYLRTGGSVQSGCCSGIRSLNAVAHTTADRRQVCNCLKSAAGSIPGINYGLVAGLPGKCGISFPYKFSPSTNCNSIS